MPDDKRNEDNIDDEDWERRWVMDNSDEMEAEGPEGLERILDSPPRHGAPVDDKTHRRKRKMDGTDDWEVDDPEMLGQTIDSSARRPGPRPSPGEDLGETLTSPAERLGRPLGLEDTQVFAPRKWAQEIGFLVVRSGPRRGGIFKLDHPRNLIGRDRNVQVFVDDPYVSGKHASIRCEMVGEKGEFVLRDLDSENGTYVNEKLISGDTILQDGDAIRVGETELVFKRI